MYYFSYISSLFQWKPWATKKSIFSKSSPKCPSWEPQKYFVCENWTQLGFLPWKNNRESLNTVVILQNQKLVSASVAILLLWSHVDIMWVILHTIKIGCEQESIFSTLACYNHGWSKGKRSALYPFFLIPLSVGLRHPTGTFGASLAVPLPRAAGLRWQDKEGSLVLQGGRALWRMSF